MTKYGITPSQTVGPYFAYSLTPTDYDFTELVTNDLVTPDATGEPIHIEGRVFDGEGQPISDALLELWQADGAGRYAGQNGARPNTTFMGFGRNATDSHGAYSFRTVLPGPVPGLEGKMQAPHIDVSFLARGVLRRMITRIYFEGQAANDGDAVLALVPEDRRRTLIARRDGTADGMPRYVFDVHLQGDDETVFFEA
jgi:protocatechuate 3,4-dioxygenase, alpha subunit